MTDSFNKDLLIILYGPNTANTETVYTSEQKNKASAFTELTIYGGKYIIIKVNSLMIKKKSEMLQKDANRIL